MINNERIAVVLPAHNGEKTLETTIRELSDGRMRLMTSKAPIRR